MKPNRPIRRFDVFAEYQRLKALEVDRLPEDQAKGYGIWLAKVVAARKFRKVRQKEGEGKEKEQKKEEKEEREALVDNKWHALDGIAQTDALFEQEIVQRMGADFYNKVFSPEIQKAVASGKDYTEIRDTIRADWKTK